MSVPISRLKAWLVLGLGAATVPAALVSARHRAPSRVEVSAASAKPAPPPSITYTLHPVDHLVGATAEPAKPRPRINVAQAMSACASEIGILCHRVLNEPWPAIRCLRRRRESLRPACLKSLSPGDDLYDAE